MTHEEFVKDAMRMMRQDAGKREERHITEMLFDEFLLNAARDGMLQKLKAAREKGRGGWWNKDECSVGYLKVLLFEHIAKGDMRDVMNLAAMIHVRTIADA